MKKILLLLFLSFLISCEKDDVDANSQDIQSLTSQISQLRGSLDTLVSLNQQYQGQIQNVQSQANSSSSSISSIQSDLSSIETNISTLTSSQSVSQSQISQLTNLIELLIVRVNQLEQNILNAQVFVPDDNFESALIQLGYDNVLDNYVLRRDIINIKNLNIERSGISSLSGIESFSSLEQLIVSYNNLSTINVSNNTSLKHLDLMDNKISTVDVSKNTNLEILVLNSNPTISLSVVNNTKLKELYVSGTNISSLSLFNNALLTDLDIGSTQITNIDLKNNTNLDRLLAISPNLSCVTLSEQVLNDFPLSCQNSNISTCYSYTNFNFSSNVNFKGNCNISEYATNTFLDDSYFSFKTKYSIGSSFSFGGKILYVNSIADVMGSNWVGWMKGQYGLNQSVAYVRVSTSSTSQPNAPHMEIFYNNVNGELLMIRSGYWLSVSNATGSCSNWKHFLYKRYYPSSLNNIDFNDNCQADHFENINLMKNAVESYIQLLN
ncbi:MAG: hypothetical protein HOK38_03385 [Flavobacteriaceae bacterium]|jgi:Leucine-rich repeat (LRR) protein|nr:hypothetical protein [Flavobacteriaceae bacterium]